MLFIYFYIVLQSQQSNPSFLQSKLFSPLFPSSGPLLGARSAFEPGLVFRLYLVLPPPAEQVFFTNDVVPPPAWVLPEGTTFRELNHGDTGPDGLYHCTLCTPRPFFTVFKSNTLFGIKSHMSKCVSKTRKGYEKDVERYDQGCDRLFQT